ncbi:hypothetical protein CW696_04345 [ANME-2 cluster archaeon]|nr:MAG: hypothetical protein CW696_04345 [ANME-2 cluster archaeon]
MINHYVTGFPADPKSFAGRGRELGEIKKAIDYTGNSEPATSQNVVIVRDWGWQNFTPAFRR